MDNGKGNFVGAWRTKEIAEHIRNKQPANHNDIVIEIYRKVDDIQ